MSRKNFSLTTRLSRRFLCPGPYCSTVTFAVTSLITEDNPSFSFTKKCLADQTFLEIIFLHWSILHHRYISSRSPQQRTVKGQSVLSKSFFHLHSKISRWRNVDREEWTSFHFQNNTNQRLLQIRLLWKWPRYSTGRGGWTNVLRQHFALRP